MSAPTGSDAGTALVAERHGPDSTVRLAVLVACAGVLQVAESMLPHPLPGVRLGLANIITLIALVHLGTRSAVALAVLRTLVGSLVIGTFLTPTFVLSLSGGVVSALVMALAFHLSTRSRFAGLGYVGISVAGSVSHVMTQVALVYLLFIRSAGVLWLWPWLMLSAVVTGVLTGLVAVQALERLKERRGAPAEPCGNPAGMYVSPASSVVGPRSSAPIPESPLRSLSPALKVAVVSVLGLAVVLFTWPWLYLSVLAVLVAAAVVGRASLARLGRSLARLWPVLAVSLAMPVLFSPWGRTLLAAGPLRVTEDGLRSGIVFTARIGLLFLATTILALTTTPHDIAAGLETLLWPLRRVGVPADRVARSLALAWSYFPLFWQRVQEGLRENRGRRGWLDRTVHLPGDIVADLYLLAGQVASDSQTSN